VGLVGVWLAMIDDEGSRELMNYWRWQAGVWKSESVMAQAAMPKT
jgi:Na+-driven multidrug efflux pump